MTPVVCRYQFWLLFFSAVCILPNWLNKILKTTTKLKKKKTESIEYVFNVFDFNYRIFVTQLLCCVRS